MYRLLLQGGGHVWVLLNHFKSKSGTAIIAAKRKRQSDGVRAIVDGLVAAGETNFIVMGDLNEGPAKAGKTPLNSAPSTTRPGHCSASTTCPDSTPDHGPAPSAAADLTSASTTSSSPVPSPRTSPAAASNDTDYGGAATNKNPPTMWETYPEITEPQQVASERAAVCIDVDLLGVTPAAPRGP
jgi:hypothetical protein